MGTELISEGRSADWRFVYASLNRVIEQGLLSLQIVKYFLLDRNL